MHDTGTNTSYNTNDTGAPTHRISGELPCAYGTAEIGCSRAFFFFLLFLVPFADIVLSILQQKCLEISFAVFK